MVNQNQDDLGDPVNSLVSGNPDQDDFGKVNRKKFWSSCTFLPTRKNSLKFLAFYVLYSVVLYYLFLSRIIAWPASPYHFPLASSLRAVPSCLANWIRLCISVQLTLPTATAGNTTRPISLSSLEVSLWERQ